jgi:hypothetical protein
MTALKDVVYYICQKYPIKGELSKARLTKLVYLADWKSALGRDRQITDIKWYFHNFGPYVDDVIDAAKSEPIFEVISTKNMYGDVKELVATRDTSYEPSLDSKERLYIDEVIDETKSMYWKRFIEHVYSTEPIKSSDRYSELDLVALAAQVK